MSHFDKVTEHISKFKTRTAQQQTFLKDGKAKACRLQSSQSLSKLCEEPKKLYPAKTEQLKQLLNMDMDLLIPPRIWVFMTRDWDHSFGVRDAETTFSKTNLANGGRELSAHVWPAFRRRLIKKQHQQDVLDRICQI